MDEGDELRNQFVQTELRGDDRGKRASIELVLAPIAKDRAQRFQTCDEFRATIDQYDGGIVVPRSSTAFERLWVRVPGSRRGGERG